MNLFVDECLSDELTQMAIDKGHWGSTSVKRRGRAGIKDWDLMPILINGDFTLVTKNSIDFRGAAGEPGSKGLYKRQELHAGLICLNGPQGMTRKMQKELFEVALEKLEELGNELINKALEVTLDSEGSDIIVRVYDIPKS